jgi:hypothetical protein
MECDATCNFYNMAHVPHRRINDTGAGTLLLTCCRGRHHRYHNTVLNSMHLRCMYVCIYACSGRVYGVHFARVGLPKWSFRPVFAALSELDSSITDGIIQTADYYWLIAGWGTSPMPCFFVYK